MSWLTGEPSDRDSLLDLRPNLAADHHRILEEVWNGAVDPTLLELCRLRTASLLGAATAQTERTPAAVAVGLDEGKIAALAAWPSDDRFTETERACLSYAEQFVIDVHGITMEQTDAAASRLGPPGMITFTTALAMWELGHRFDNALGAS